MCCDTCFLLFCVCLGENLREVGKLSLGRVIKDNAYTPSIAYSTPFQHIVL